MKDQAQFSIPTRRSLISRIKNWESRESWQEFYDTYWRLVYSVARHSGLTDTEAQDVVQETFCHVAKNIPSFRYDPALGSFKNWLLHMTRWHIADQFRKRPKVSGPQQGHETNDRTTSTAERVPDPSCAVAEVYEEEWKRNLQNAALERVKNRVKPKQYQAFFLYALKELPMAEITAVLGMTRNQVYLAKLRITRLIAQEVRRLERQICRDQT